MNLEDGILIKEENLIKVYLNPEIFFFMSVTDL